MHPISTRRCMDRPPTLNLCTAENLPHLKQTGYECALPEDPDDCIPAQLKLYWPWAERCHTPLDLSQPCGLLSL